MKVIDCINKNINDWPSLYLMDNYEDSAFNVLHHYFIVLGNGVEWADTGDLKTGGYLVEPIARRVGDEWERMKDSPYGEEKHELDFRAFKEKIYWVRVIDHATTKELEILMPDMNDVDNTKAMYESELIKLVKKGLAISKYSHLTHESLYYFSEISKHRSREKPYPNFKKEYSCFWEIEPHLIQKDWRLAGIGHLKYWRNYFNAPERVKNYHYYKNPKSLKEWITSHYKNKPEKYPDWIQTVRDNYEYQRFNGENFGEMSEIRWEKELSRTKMFISETIERLENV